MWQIVVNSIFVTFAWVLGLTYEEVKCKYSLSSMSPVKWKLSSYQLTDIDRNINRPTSLRFQR